MPVLPSGRRIEFSLDRFLAMLDKLNPEETTEIKGAIDKPDDLLPVVDVVAFDTPSGEPRFAGYVASDWEQHAKEWSFEDRSALRAHLRSELSIGARAIAIAALRNQLVEFSVRVPKSVAPVAEPEADLLAA